MGQQGQQPAGRSWPGTETPAELLGSGRVKGSLTQGPRQMWEGSCPVSDHSTCGWVHLSQWPFKAWGHGTKVGWHMEMPVHHPGSRSLKNMLSRIVTLSSSFQPCLGVCWALVSPFLCLMMVYRALNPTSEYFCLYFIPNKSFLVSNKDDIFSNLIFSECLLCTDHSPSVCYQWKERSWPAHIRTFSISNISTSTESFSLPFLSFFPTWTRVLWRF